MTRLAVMAHYDPRGEVAPHVRRQVEALAEAVDDLVIVSTAELSDASRVWLEKHGRVLPRANYGYDFFSYKTGLESTPLGGYDEVVVCNDTYVGPLVGYTRDLRGDGRPARRLLGPDLLAAGAPARAELLRGVPALAGGVAGVREVLARHVAGLRPGQGDQPVRGRADQGDDRRRLHLVGVLLGDRARPHPGPAPGGVVVASTGSRRRAAAATGTG